MRVIADHNIPGLEALLGGSVELRRVEGRGLRRAALDGADALFVRSVTRVGADLLAGTSVRFVGTATIGTDHLDKRWLDTHGIHWASAPGCNADAAAQYTLAMILLAWRRLGRPASGERVGIIGCGNVGGRLQRLLDTLGVPTLACDPPREARGETDFVPLEAVLRQPTVSLHVPLTDSGPWPTRAMIDKQALAAMPPQALLVNAARGDVLHRDAVGNALLAHRLRAAFDVWPGEPAIDAAWRDACVVATPHVAGYSQEGRLNGAIAVTKAFCEWSGLEPPGRGIGRSEPVALDTHHATGWVDRILEAVPVVRDDRSLRELGAGAPDLGRGFDALRRNYALRRDFSGIALRGLPRRALERARRLGFHPASG